MLHFFTKRPAAALKARIALKLKSLERQIEGTAASYREDVSCLLMTYATDDILAESDIDMIRFSQLGSKWTTGYAEAL